MKVSGKSGNPMQAAEAAKLNKSTSEAVSGLTGGLTGGSKKNSAAAETFNPSGSAKVDLSPRAQDIKKAKELAMSSNDIDEAKVARLQKLIDEGKYKVDAAAVADRLVDEHLRTES
ncbi:MAG: flagellar biosynthesis anti-sigma factor FlgM [Bdellovibrionaceae bacterium]|nr:flagellar biosynthesis anti-sigma factor FlgM [Pseudobdellovibrionaceae bacterium]